MKRTLYILLVLCAPLLLRAEPSAVRSFVGTTVSSTRSIVCEIVLTPGVNPPNSIVLVEYLPHGWSVSGATWNNNPFTPTVDGDSVKWLFGISPAVSAGTLRYTLQPDEAIERTYAVNGSLLFSASGVNTSRPVTGATELTASDEDNDGMPDDWERKYFDGNPVGALAHVDSDGDGLSNLDEYRARTNPRDPASRVALLDVTPDGSDLLLRWSAAAGTQVELRAKSSLLDVDSTLLRLTTHPADGEAQTRVPRPTGDVLFVFLRVRSR